MAHAFWTSIVGTIVLAALEPSSAFEISELVSVADDECHAALQIRAAAPGPTRGPVERSVERAAEKKGPRWRDATCFGNLGSRYCQQQTRANGTCVCKDGCMGADGNCWSQSNTAIGSGFTLTNMKWSSWKMYVQGLSAFGQLRATRVHSALNLAQDKFQLYELPGVLDGQKQYILASHRWTDHVVMMDMTGGTALSLWGAYAVDLAEYHEPWELKNVMLHVCSARSKGHPDAIMIGSSSTPAGSASWLYLKEGTFNVFGYWYPERLIAAVVSGKGPMDVSRDPGDDGYWIPHPAFEPDVLPDC